MDIKRVFDHISKTWLITYMLELELNKDFICWAKSFLINRKLLLVIHNHNNPKKKIKTKILQGSRVSPILFLIYISGVFD